MQTEGDSKMNRLEAEKVLDILEVVLDAGGCKVADIGIITPYKAQVFPNPYTLHHDPTT